MKAYVDTNVLVAASIEEHQHHVQAFDLVKAVKKGRLQGCISTQGLAEFYSVLTRAPFTPRIHPAEAGRLLDERPALFRVDRAFGGRLQSRSSLLLKRRFDWRSDL